jgi:hypothetical protein
MKSWLWVVWPVRADVLRLWREEVCALGAVAARVAGVRRAEEVLGELCDAVNWVGAGVVVGWWLWCMACW